MLTNQKAKVLARKYSGELIDGLGDNLILVMLFGSSIEDKENLGDVDLFVCTRNGVRSEYSPKHAHIVYYTLREVKQLIEGFGRGNLEMIRRLFLGGAEVLYDARNYYRRINNAFASGNPKYMNLGRK